MSVVDTLGQALLENDWSKVQEVYMILGGKIENISVEPVKKRRGRPKKEKLGPSGGGSPVTTNIEDDFTVVKPVQERPKPISKGGKNLFDPRTPIEESDPKYAKVNDNITRSPRERPPVPISQQVYCGDCGKHVNVPNSCSLLTDMRRCEYAVIGKQAKCPYSK